MGETRDQPASRLGKRGLQAMPLWPGDTLDSFSESTATLRQTGLTGGFIDRAVIHAKGTSCTNDGPHSGREQGSRKQLLSSLFSVDLHFGPDRLDPFWGLMEEGGQRHSRTELSVPTRCCLMHCQLHPAPLPSFRTPPVRNPKIYE